MKGTVESVRIPPKILQLKVLTNHPVEVDLHLPRNHRFCSTFLTLKVLRVLWKIPALTFDKTANGLTAVSPELVITVNGYDLVTAAVS